MEFTWQDVIVILIVAAAVVAFRWAKAWESRWLDEPEDNEADQ